VERIAVSLFPLVYVAMPFALSSVLLHADTQVLGLMLFAFFAILWTNDSMAYVSGMLLGKNRLFERISPKKSWEGFIGGLLFSLLVGFIVFVISNEFSWYFWLGYALIISLSATFGDLLESLMKRNSGIKDSGNILPGHGGVLDRFDGAIMAFPFAVAYLWFCR
jgi:phosphatidate cytidylyltransferase